MREAVLVVVIIAVCGAGLAGAEMAILGYIWFSLMRPDAFAYSALPISIVLAGVALVSSVRKLPQMANVVKSPISGLLILQQVPIGISVLVAVDPTLSYVPYDRYIRIIIMALLIPVVINSEIWLRRLVLVMACSMGFVALKFGVFSLVFGGASLVKGYAGMIGDSNGLALAMVILLPLCLYGRDLVEPVWQKWILLGIAVFAVVTVVMTGSRGNALAMGAVLLLVTMRSKYKLAGLLGILLLTMPALYLAGDRFTNRMATISEYEEDDSASGRLEFWSAALKMSRDYPIFGVGYGEKNYVALASQYMGRDNRWVVHNTYLQMLVDCGVIELVLYVGTLWGAIFWLGRSVSRMRRLKPEWLPYPLALQTSILAFAVGSTFYSRGDFEFIYMVLMTAACWQVIEKKELTLLRQAAEAPRAAAPVSSVTPPAIAAEVEPPAPPRLRGGRPVPLRRDTSSPGTAG